jgi:predicted transcriptional regulator of viral defense system
VSAVRFAVIQRLGVRSITTAQAAAAWRVSSAVASRTLRELAAAGLVEQLRHGLWLLDRHLTTEELAPEIVAPYPAYVSHLSAFYMHGIITQVPADVHLVAATEPRLIQTSRGRYRLHRMPHELFGGFSDVRGVPLASPEKALFDWAYLSAVAGSPNARLPECEWPANFRRAEVERWLKRIASQRARTMTASLISRRLGQRVG